MKRKLHRDHRSILFLAVILAAIVPATRSFGQDSDFKAFRVLMDAGRIEDAKALLNSKWLKPANNEEKALAGFALGTLHYQSGTDDLAQNFLTESIQLNARLEDYGHFLLGAIHRRQGRKDDAKKEFESTLASPWKGRFTQDARFQIATIATDEKQWSQALLHLNELERRARSHSDYPRILYFLVRAELGHGQRSKACKWALKLYSKYPSIPEVKDWGIDLQNVQVDGTSLGCIATLSDQKKRLRALQYSGESEKARQEIDFLSARSGASKLQTESLLGNYLVEEGDVEQAFKLLIPHYDVAKDDPNYLMLLAKAASRAGEYQVAVGAYDRVYEMMPRDKNGRNALFMAAFLSYQVQDLEGANRRFEILEKQFVRSGLSRDAKWYLGWIRYHKGDFEEARKYFAQVSPPRRGRGRRSKPTGFSQERIQYWIAMAFFRENKKMEARRIFEQLARDRAYGYYSLVSRARLHQIKSDLTINSESISVSENPPNFQDSVSSFSSLPETESSELSSKPSRPGTTGVFSPFDFLSSMNLGTSIRDVLEKSRRDGKRLLATDDKKTGVRTSQSVLSDLELAGDVEASNDLESGRPEEEMSDVEETEEVEGTQKEAVVDADPAEGSKLGEGLLNSQFISGLKDNNMTELFQRAGDLASLGFREWARFELAEIEGRTRSRERLRMLMYEHEENHSYNRSSYLAEVNFGGQRLAQGLGGARYLWEYAYPRAFQLDVIGVSKEFSIPTELVWSIMRAESRYRVDAKSSVGAWGLMQVMPFTARQISKMLNIKDFKTAQLLDPSVNIRIGSRYLQRLMKQFQGRVHLAAAAYNAGPHRVVSWVKSWGTLEMDEFVEQIPYLQTRNYVKKVTHNYYVYSVLGNISGAEVSVPQWLCSPVALNFEGPIPTKESWDTSD